MTVGLGRTSLYEMAKRCFTDEQKLPITRSEGVYFNGDSLKIEF
ncbi:hypothetical protein [Paenibacillus thiaminolyticus]|nr:hypothetical protein [Paenibacillus thiaminolyticus]MEC0062008.1 hypothetical protein [Paenibacillus thiaminolyticus]MEC0103143.1 hypothetical protein [Paenibacillus thiaminolyticus]SUA97614.1 Uncharacterised protein [Paenibacillus thiaminolyticus]